MSAITDMFSQYLIQYGLAGLVLYVFYKLFSNELKDLKQAVDRLNETIMKLIERLNK
ncbi:MAG: hypothetical protein QXF61_07910 [Nitrososphaeria archaeon]